MADEENNEEDPILNTVVAGRYEVYAKLGEGGMGAVYAARQAPLGRTVALKVLLRALSEDPIAVKRFEKEALAISRLAHPNTVTIFDFGRTEKGLMYIAMEFMEGRTLRQAIEVEAPIEARRAVRILAQMVRALSEAHQRGVIHRDLKPDNIMLVPTAGEPDFVKVLDFGVAKLRAGKGMDVKTLTQGDVIFGTPRYMSPEQVNGVMDDARSDLYALGAIAYEMLSGTAVFDGDSAMKILMAHLQQQPRPFAELPKPIQVPAPLEALVMRLLDKVPDDRYQSCDDLLVALDELPRVGGGLRPPSGKTEGLQRPLLGPDGEPVKAQGTQMMGSDFAPRGAEEAPVQADLATEAYVDGPPPLASAEAEVGGATTQPPAVSNKTAETRAMPMPGPAITGAISPRKRNALPIIIIVLALLGLAAVVVTRVDWGGGTTGPDPQAASEAILTINTGPAGATIFIDDDEVGRSPLSVAVSVQRQHQIRAELDGHEPYLKPLTLEGPESVNLILTALTVDAGAATADAATGRPPRKRKDAGVAPRRRDAGAGKDRGKSKPPQTRVDAGVGTNTKPPVDFKKWDDFKDPTGDKTK